jgi:hypothetical protein
MHRYVQLPILLIPLMAGCAYIHDRGRDACDMVTLAVEAPTANASIQVGKAVLGIGAGGGKGFGLRSGALGVYEAGEANILLTGVKYLVPNEDDRNREKGYEYSYQWLPWRNENEGFIGSFDEGRWFNAWQLEADLGLGIGVRAGVNLAEIVDFILGWTTLDICGDDIKTIERKDAEAFERSREETANQRMVPTD